MKSYREWKKDQEELQNEFANPYQQLKQTGMDLGRMGATKLGAITDALVQMAGNKNTMGAKIINLLKQAVRGEPNEKEMLAQLNNAWATLKRVAQPQPGNELDGQ